MDRSLRLPIALVSLSIVAALPAAAVVGRGSAGAQGDESMSIKATEKTLAAYAEALFGGGAYEDFLAEDVTLSMVDSDLVVEGRAAVKAMIDDLHHVAFDATPEVVETVVGEGRAALELTFIGTHTGEFGGVAATGREINVPYAVFYEFADDQITSLRIYWPTDEILRQLGTTG